MNTIIAYQFRETTWLQSDTISDYRWNDRCYIHFGPSVHMMDTVVARWIIRIKQSPSI